MAFRLFRLIATVEHSAAVALILQHLAYFTELQTNSEAKSIAQAGLDHLHYLNVNWMSLSLWQSWSEWGRLKAAAAIGIPVQGVIPTTNHLESFNGLLKRKYIKNYLHSGHRLRFNMLIFLFITQILPQVFTHQ